MATSGTYTYAPDIADIQEYAFRLCGVDVATLDYRHSKDARMAMNMLFSYWSTKGTNLFAVDLQTRTVTEGTPSYTATDGTLAILEVTVTRSSVETPVHRISRESYQLLPNKTNEGLPTQLFYDRIANTFWLWNTPENSTDVINYWRLRRIQDVSTGQETPDVPYEWNAALVYGLGEFLAPIYAPDRTKGLMEMALERFLQANQFNRERTSTTFTIS
jgi:hypothetical protein